MADFKGYSVNYSWNSQPAVKPVEKKKQPLWALAECTVFSLPQEQLLLKLKHSDKKLVTSQEVYQLLQLCSQFKTLAEHVETILGAMPELTGKRAETVQLLEQFIQQGFMLSAEDVLAELTAQSVNDSAMPLFGVIIRTCDRPQQLERLLNSILQLHIQSDQHYHFWIADDSREIANLIQNEQLIQRFCSTDKPLKIHYYGPQQQQKFTTQLKQIFPDNTKQIEWLLEAHADKTNVFTGGRMLNHLLLMSAGQRFLLMDDDIICQTHQTPDFIEGLSVSVRHPEVTFYHSRESVCESLKQLELNPFTEHLEALGASVASSLSRFKSNPEILQGLEGSNILKLKTSSRVMRTISGIVGDPGTFSLAWIYEMEGVTREHLLSNPEQFQQFRSNRCLWLGSASRTLSVEPALMMTSLTGIDNSQLLPPVCPWFRNEDYLFGHLCKYLYPESVTMDFPWGLVHFPEPPRHWSEDKLDQPKNAGVLAFLADIAQYQNSHCLAEHADQRLSFLAEMYLALADSDDTALAEGIEENLLHTRVATINQLQKQLETHGQQPVHWAQDINRLLKANGEALIHSEIVVSDAHAGRDRIQQVQTVREILEQMGLSMKIWPDLWQYCQQHHDELFDY